MILNTNNQLKINKNKSQASGYEVIEFEIEAWNIGELEFETEASVSEIDASARSKPRWSRLCELGIIRELEFEIKAPASSIEASVGLIVRAMDHQWAWIRMKPRDMRELKKMEWGIEGGSDGGAWVAVIASDGRGDQ